MTGAHHHRLPDHLIHLLVLPEQEELGAATDKETLLEEDSGSWHHTHTSLVNLLLVGNAWLKQRVVCAGRGGERRIGVSERE